jgi:hypothetical protein
MHDGSARYRGYVHHVCYPIASGASRLTRVKAAPSPGSRSRGCVYGLWLSESQIPRIQACGIAKAQRKQLESRQGPGIDPGVGPGTGPRVGPAMGPGVNPGIRGRAEAGKDDCCGSGIYPRGYPAGDTVTF